MSLPLWWSMLRKDGPATRGYCSELDASRGVLDVLVLVASLAAMAGVGWMLFVSTSTGTAKVWEALVAVGAVVGGWLLVHTSYALRHARHWWAAQPGCVDFGTDEPPFSDSLHLATCLDMTFQVADTSFRTPEVRRIALFHTLLSHGWGTVIVASTIDLVLGLAQ